MKKFVASLLLVIALALQSSAFAARPYFENIDNATPFSVLSATATGTTTITRAARLFNLTLTAQHATTDFWIKIYDKATAATHSDTPVYRVFVNAQGTVDLVFNRGLALSNGLSIRCVTEAADSGTTAAGSNECTVNGTYK